MLHVDAGRCYLSAQPEQQQSNRDPYTEAPAEPELHSDRADVGILNLIAHSEPGEWPCPSALCVCDTESSTAEEAG